MILAVDGMIKTNTHNLRPDMSRFHVTVPSAIVYLIPIPSKDQFPLVAGIGYTIIFADQSSLAACAWLHV